MEAQATIDQIEKCPERDHNCYLGKPLLHDKKASSKPGLKQITAVSVIGVKSAALRS